MPRPTKGHVRGAATGWAPPVGPGGTTDPARLASDKSGRAQHAGVTKGAEAKPGSASRRARARADPTDDWRVETLSRIRRLIQAADPDIIEERKWRKPSNPAGVPVWSHDGIICTGETYKDHLRLTFAHGASLKDPSRLFNSGLEGNVTRAIVLHEGDTIDGRAFRSLIRAAAALNASSGRG
jgi:hypothetical protein